MAYDIPNYTAWSAIGKVLASKCMSNEMIVMELQYHKATVMKATGEMLKQKFLKYSNIDGKRQYRFVDRAAFEDFMTKWQTTGKFPLIQKSKSVKKVKQYFYSREGNLKFYPWESQPIRNGALDAYKLPSLVGNSLIYPKARV